MKLFKHLALTVTAAVAMTVATLVPARAEKVEIEYWQYFFDGRVKAMNALIKQFEEQNPDITVVHRHFPYDQYRTKVAAAVPAGQGPDVVQLFYGWLGEYQKAGLLQPLSKENFNPAKIDAEYFPMVREMKVDGQYWAVPTAVRTLALFWNKKLFREAGLDRPPQTNDELIAFAQKITKRNDKGVLEVEGITVDPSKQDQHWWREVLVRQFGGKPFSDDNRKVAYNNEAGLKATTWYADLFMKHKVADLGFLEEGNAAFRAGRAGMTIDGNFRLPDFAKQTDLEYGIAELPSHNGIKSNYASYWVNGVTSKAKGAKREAAEKFLLFVTTPEAMQLWLKEAGELPARRVAALTPANLADPIYGPFVKGLDYAHATNFVAEIDQRKINMDMFDRIRIGGLTPEVSLKKAAEDEQKLLDKVYGK